MKKGITLGLVLCLCMVMLAGCGEGQKDKNPLAVYKNGKEVVSVGMTLEEVEKNIGKGKKDLAEDSKVFSNYEYEGLIIRYSNETVNSFKIIDKDYKDAKGISVGTLIEKLKDYYTENEIIMNNDIKSEIAKTEPCRVYYDENYKIINSKEKNELSIHVIEYQPSLDGNTIETIYIR